MFAENITKESVSAIRAMNFTGITQVEILQVLRRYYRERLAETTAMVVGDTNEERPLRAAFGKNHT